MGKKGQKKENKNDKRRIEFTQEEGVGTKTNIEKKGQK